MVETVRSDPATLIEAGSRPLFGPADLTRATWALFAGLGLLMVGNGLQGSLLGFRAEVEGFDITATGVMMAGYAAGFLLGGRVAVQTITAVGHIRVFAALASMASTASLAHALWITPVSWTAMRFIFGLCMAGLYVVTESWLNDLATNATRGRLLSVYMVVSMLGLAAGNLLLRVADPRGFTLFILASILVSLSLIPITLSAASAPPLSVPKRMGLSDLWNLVPTGLVSTFFVGYGHGALLGLAAFYATRAGLPADRVAIFVAAPAVGAVMSQWLVGWISDHVPRRAVIVVVAVGAAVVSAGIATVDADTWLAVGLMLALGALTYPLYSVVVAQTSDWMEPEQLLGATATLIRVNGSGALLGPLLGGFIMSAAGDRSLFVSLTVSHLIVAAWVMFRIFVAEAPDRRRRLVAFPARPSSFVVNLMPRRRRQPPPDHPTRSD